MASSGTSLRRSPTCPSSAPPRTCRRSHSRDPSSTPPCTPACSAGVPGRVTPGWQTRPMAFGQAAGPPASRRQVETLGELIRAAGHRDFRDARGPLGLNQRQAGGRFTRDEADALITRLETEADLGPPPEDDAPAA